jgi:hypothetical protein
VDDFPRLQWPRDDEPAQQMQRKMEEMMAGILDFLTNVGGNQDLAAKFMKIIASPDCTRQDLQDFFGENNYADVSDADIGKLMDQREKIQRDFNMPGNVDY